ncbi:HNH endonuclease [Mycobacterium marinum]|uniref:HNH endonuclease n=1 Tax=Mycobacterium marinum TaxID=1781 RepID=UPI00235852F5|nr:hypothetical protein [Mycobacterium marinum]MDC9003259.1 hypothetical protein [Mycobacterium marinum]
METPQLDDARFQKAGTLVKGALWLANEVGVGNTFTKEQLRQAFPGISQIDRRIRDLRDYGWVIRSNTEDASLRPEEQRFVRQGLRVWDPAERRKGGASTLPARERREVFERDGYQCTVCGIAGGESYPDRDYETAVLTIMKTPVTEPGDAGDHFVTQCRRCKSGQTAAAQDDVQVVLSNVRALSEEDRQRLARWASRDRRGPTPLDRVWTSYRQLPADLRDRVKDEITE